MTIILYFFKYLMDVGRCLAGYFLLADAIDLDKFSQHFEHKSRFIALAAMGHRCHIGGIGLKDDTVKGHHSEGLRQAGFLKSKHTANAEHKPIELQQFAGFDLVTGEAMKHATRQVVTVFLKNSHHLILRLTTVDHQGQTRLYRPTDLFLESFQLFLLEFTGPIEIKAYFTNGDRTHWGRF